MTSEGMACLIRPATIAEYEPICALFAEGDTFHAEALPDQFRPAVPARTREFVAEFLETEGAHILLAELEGEIAGLVQFRVQATPERSFLVPRTFVAVDSLIVRRRSRRRGIGGALMEAVHTWARDRGILEVELGVFEFNQGATRLYEGLGYKTVGRRMRRKAGADDNN